MAVYIEGDRAGFSPEEFADVKRCLETLCSVRSGSQPLDREIGIDWDGIAGYPVNVAKNMLSLEIIAKVKIYEPRVSVESVSCEVDTDGHLVPHIYFVKAEG